MYRTEGHLTFRPRFYPSEWYNLSILYIYIIYSTPCNVFFALSTELQQLKSSWEVSRARIRETKEKVAFEEKQVDSMLQQIPDLERQETELCSAVSVDQNVTEIRTYD